MVVDQHEGKGPGPFVMKVGVCKKKPARGGWKDCNTHQEAVLPNRQGM